MSRKDDFNPWVQRATRLYRDSHDKSFHPYYNDAAPKEPIPATTGADGIFFGVLDFDNMKSFTRDASCNAEMKRYGYDPEMGLEQVRFKRPVLAQGVLLLFCVRHLVPV